MNVMIRENCWKQVLSTFCDEVQVLAAAIHHSGFHTKPFRIDEAFEGSVKNSSAKLGALPQLDAAVCAAR